MRLRRRLRHLRTVLTDRRWWPFYLQRRFMNQSARNGLARLATRLRPRPLNEEPASDVQTRAIALGDVGFEHLGQLLSEAQVAEVRAYLRSKPVADPYRPTHGSFLPDATVRHPESHVAYHTGKDVVLAPYLLELANRADLLEVASCFLGCRPTISYCTAWWSYHTPAGPQEAENFHRDVDDWRFIKLFVYLSEVTAADGPHVYVKNSVGSARLRQIRRFDDADVTDAFGPKNVLTLTGRAGQGFLENTFGIHKGQPVDQGPRLIFQAVYSMFPLPYGPRAPVARLQDVVFSRGSPDPWINRLYLHRT